MSHVRRFYIVKNRQNQTTICLETMKDVEKFIQTKQRRSIVDREDWNEYPGLFDGLYK
jgi:hypothetical protein